MSADKRVWWGDFTAREFENLDPHETIAVLPIAATEQHGPHLPVSTDHTIMAGMLEAVFAQLPGDLDVRFLPIQCIGKSNEHIRVPGTLTLDATTIIDAWTQIGGSIARAGIRKLVMVNSHGGNEELMGIVARELRVRHDMLVAKTSWMRFSVPEGLFSEYDRAYGIHGDDYETSVMLHLSPDVVQMDKVQNFTSAVPKARETFRHLAHQSPHAFAWIAGDLNPQGVVGESHLATAEKGAACVTYQTKGFVELLQDVRAAKLDEWLTG
ncbi:MAG: creatininase family protein [Pseudomonadota bacterium]